MTIRKRWTWIGVLALAAGPAVPGVHAQAPVLGQATREAYPTNLSMLREAAESAVTELFLGFDAPAGATLLVQPGIEHEGNWFIEELILARLHDAGYNAYLQPTEEGAPPVPEETSLDSDDENPEAGLTAGGPASDFVFRYRIVEFGILYPDSYRRSPLGSRRVQRHATVILSAQLLAGQQERILWIGQGDAERLDVVPSSKLSFLEGKAFPFAAPELETRGVGRFVEPALVTGIVAGLIYLFYTNQN